jgi:hypothetical protein
MKYPFTILAMLLAVASWPVYAADKDHLACYQIDGGDAKEKVTIFDQFFPHTDKKTNVKDSELLCDPAEKKDHDKGDNFTADEAKPKGDFVYKCYEVHPNRKANKKVMVEDQFFPHGDRVTVKKLRYLCTPAEKFHKK